MTIHPLEDHREPYVALSDARTDVQDRLWQWDWGPDADPAAVLESLARYLFDHSRTLDDGGLRAFIVEVLGEDPAMYGL